MDTPNGHPPWSGSTPCAFPRQDGSVPPPQPLPQVKLETDQGKRNSDIVDRFIIAMVSVHPYDIARLAAEACQVSRVTVTKRLQRLLHQGILTCEGRTKARRYQLAVLTESTITIPVSPTLQEDQVWQTHIKPCLGPQPMNIINLLAHAVTKTINNIIDHAGASLLTITVHRTAAMNTVILEDNGVGLFTKIRSVYQVPDIPHAAFEVIKGQVTTDPDRHSGHGLLFAARMCDEYVIRSSGWVWGYQAPTNEAAEEGRWWVQPDPCGATPGTTVSLRLSTMSTRTPELTLQHNCRSESSGRFSRTRLPLALVTTGEEPLISRSQAKRLLARTEQFDEIVLDFDGVPSIGQGFADEVFRVYRSQHPTGRLLWVGENADVKHMIQHVLASQPVPQ